MTDVALPLDHPLGPPLTLGPPPRLMLITLIPVLLRCNGHTLHDPLDTKAQNVRRRAPCALMVRPDDTNRASTPQDGAKDLGVQAAEGEALPWQQWLEEQDLHDLELLLCATTRCDTA